MAELTEATIKDSIKTALTTLFSGQPLKAAKGISDEELNAVYSLAYSYYSTGKYDDALKLFKFLVMFDHLNAKYWDGLGSVHQVQKNYDDAIAAYAQSVMLDSSNPRPVYYSALCYFAKGEKLHAAASVQAFEMLCTKKDETTAKYREKIAALKAALGDDTFKELERIEAEDRAKKAAKKA